MARIYLETSFVSACVERRESPADIYRREASLLWWHEQRRRHDIFVSAEVLRELGDSRYPLRAQALELVRDVPILAIREEAIGLASLLVREKAMPPPALGDALHVAIATIESIDYMLSWNVRHLANPIKLQQVRTICLRAGVAPPLIVTPDTLWETDP